MMKKIIIFGLLAVILATATSAVLDWEIIGDSVVLDNNLAYFNITPHTIVGDGWVYETFESKVYSGDMNHVWFFETIGDQAVKPKKLQYWNPHVENTTESYTCDLPATWNYTTNPLTVYCWLYANNTDNLLFSHVADGYDVETNTWWWYELENVDWSDYPGDIDVFNIDFNNKNKAYVVPEVHANAGQQYKIRYYLDTPHISVTDTEIRTFKYDRGFYPSIYGVSWNGLYDAYNAGHLMYIDPFSKGTNDLHSVVRFENGTLLDEVGPYTYTNASGGSIKNSDPISNNYYDGINTDYITASAGVLNDIGTNNDFTIIYWINPDTHSGHIGAWQDGDTYWYFGTNGDNEVESWGKDGSWGGIESGLKYELNSWNMLGLSYNSSNGGFIIYVNDSSYNTSPNSKANPVSRNDWMGFCVHATGTASACSSTNTYDGRIDEFMMWDVALDGSEIEELWNSGTGLFYDDFPAVGANNPPVIIDAEYQSIIMVDETNDFNFTATDVEDTWFYYDVTVWANGVNLTSEFVGGGNASNNTKELGRGIQAEGTPDYGLYIIWLNVTDLNNSNASASYSFVYNDYPEISNVDYKTSLDNTTSNNVNATFTDNLNATDLTITATLFDETGTNLTGHFYTKTGAANNTEYSIFNITPANITDKSGNWYFWLNVSDDGGGNWSNRYNFTVSSPVFSINASDNITGAAITSFWAVVNGTNYSTNTSIIYTTIGGDEGVFNVTVGAADHNINSYTDHNVSIRLQAELSPYNYLNITFLDEISSSIITSENMSLEIISDAITYQYWTTTGNITTTNITSGNYSLRYSGNESYIERFYYLEVIDNSYNEINLYSTIENTSNYENVTATVYNEYNEVIEGVTIQVLRYYVGTNSYNVVEMAETNFLGKATLHLILNSEFYKFYLYYPSDTLRTTTTPSYISETEIEFRINLQEDVLQDWYDSHDITHSLSFNNVTNNFRFDYTDLDEVATSYCLKVNQVKGTGKTLIGTSCSSSHSGTLLYNVTPVNQTTYSGTAYAVINGDNYVLAIEYHTFLGGDIWGKIGLFVIIFMCCVFAFVGLYNPSIAAILTPLPIVIGAWLQIIHIPVAVAIIVQVAGLVLAFVLGGKK